MISECMLKFQISIICCLLWCECRAPPVHALERQVLSLIKDGVQKWGLWEEVR